jgi:S1-C subfamily serine protease
MVAQSHVLSPSEIYRQVVRSTATIITDVGTLGSGFYVAPNVVATNYHVVEGATEVKQIQTEEQKK